MADKTLYERLGGLYNIAAVVDYFSDQLLKNPKIVNANPELKEWHTVKYHGRLAGLKFGRTLWLCWVSGGPFKYNGKALRDAHWEFKITPEVFNEVAEELALALDHFKVPKREKEEVLAAFAAQTDDVTAGSISAPRR